ncbi:MAG: tRNA-intron lyase [Candidatus Bathyarchaeota archaeon]|nr:tRNA-intron lyase [Candidatus Bathyarchaeota archaeon]
MKGSQKQAEPSRNHEIKEIKAELSEENVVVRPREKFGNLTSRGYGTVQDKKLVLNVYEALFLKSKGLLEVFNGKPRKPLDFQELLHRFGDKDENVWVKYLIYRDLRSRGYVVRDGFGLGIDFRVYERGEYSNATATYLILGLQEGKPISIQALVSILKHVQSLKKKMVLAVVNRRGEIVYYTLSKLTMR